MSDITVQQHYVEFQSPGTFLSEVSRKKIDAWDTTTAIEMMREVKERYGARPYGFRFLTFGRGPNDLDSREIARSHFYYVNCDVLTAEEILADDDPNYQIMRSNVRSNGTKRVARTRSGWLGHYPMCDDDQMIEAPDIAPAD